MFQAARAAVARAGAAARCEVYRGGCYGLCHLGPNVVIREETRWGRELFSREDFQLMGWPGEAYYWAMDAEKVARVVAEHVLGGVAVEELLGKKEREEELRAKADGGKR